MTRKAGLKKPGICPGFKLWVAGPDGEGVFGGGKWRLLDAIDRTGSLRSAADALGISYRKAWGDLRKVEQALGVAFLERRRGGTDGGSMVLTETGKRWLREYARFQRSVEKAVEKAFDAWMERLKS